MQAVYNFTWEGSYSPIGVSYYMLSINGNVYNCYTNNMEIAQEENTSVHAEVRAVDFVGQISEPAVMDFMVPDYVDPTPPPTVPGNFIASFVRWQ